MSATFDPRLEILPESQLRLWQELDAVPPDFVLYGGTGLALQLGHRASEYFDFFSSSGFEPDRLRSRLPFCRDPDPTDPDLWVHHKRDNRTTWRPSSTVGDSLRCRACTWRHW
jgi:hypothetical protein